MSGSGDEGGGLAERRRRVRAAALAELPKHRRFGDPARFGRALSASMLPFFLVRPSKGYGILTTTGRRTGKRRRKCVRVVRVGDTAYLVQLMPPELAVERPGAAGAWLLNIRADPRVRLRLPDGEHTAVAREITDPAELAEARTALCTPIFTADFGECLIHLRGRPSREKIRDLHRYWFDTGHPIAVDL